MAKFTSEMVKRAWCIKKNLGCNFGDAMRFSLKFEGVTGLRGLWTVGSVEAVAGHFWGLSKAYDLLGDVGRAVAMNRVAVKLYEMKDQFIPVSLDTLRTYKYFGASVISEIEAYWNAAAVRGFTARAMELREKVPAYFENARACAVYF